MTLKTFISPIVRTACVTVLMLTSCVSHVQKADDAFDRVKKERMLTDDSSFTTQEIMDESMKTELVKKKQDVEKQDEWTRFKLETEAKIHTNENRIIEIRARKDLAHSLRRKVTGLEKDNNELRKRMDEYKEEVKVQWEMFKASMDHNVNEIDIELKAIKMNK